MAALIDMSNITAPQHRRRIGNAEAYDPTYPTQKALWKVVSGRSRCQKTTYDTDWVGHEKPAESLWNRYCGVHEREISQTAKKLSTMDQSFDDRQDSALGHSLDVALQNVVFVHDPQHLLSSHVPHFYALCL